MRVPYLIRRGCSNAAWEGGRSLKAIVIIAILAAAPAAAAGLPLNEPLSLYPRLAGVDSMIANLQSPELAFTVESVTRRISILGWASERYDLSVGQVLAGELEEDTLILYVYPDCILSSRIGSLSRKDCLIVVAEEDTAHEHTEGFRASGRDMAVVKLLGVSDHMH